MGRWARALAVLAVCLAAFFPIYWMCLLSVRPARETIAYPPLFFPRVFRFEAYVELFQSIPLHLWLGNTVIVSSGVTLITVALSILGAYALSAFRWRGRGLFGFTLLGSQMLPEALLIVPLFVILRKLRLIDSLLGVTLADAAFIVPIGVWILKGFFDQIPREVREAALVDGCTPLGVLCRIVVPLSLPGLVAVSVVAFFDGWNEYLFASTFITTPESRLASVGLASFIGEVSTPIELVLAAATLFTIFPVVFYLIMQRYIVEGLTGGAVKG